MKGEIFRTRNTRNITSAAYGKTANLSPNKKLKITIAVTKFVISEYIRQFLICGMIIGRLTTRDVTNNKISPAKPYQSFGNFPVNPSRIILIPDSKFQVTNKAFESISTLVMKILTKAKMVNEIATIKYNICSIVEPGFVNESSRIACNSAKTKEIIAVAILK